jgi:hypothetical protein
MKDAAELKAAGKLKGVARELYDDLLPIIPMESPFAPYMKSSKF